MASVWLTSMINFPLNNPPNVKIIFHKLHFHMLQVLSRLKRPGNCRPIMCAIFYGPGNTPAIAQGSAFLLFGDLPPCLSLLTVTAEKHAGLALQGSGGGL